MDMDIDIRHIARLARLKLSDDKVEKFEKEMQGIVEMVQNLPPLDASGSLVDPDNTMELRPDVPEASFPRDEMLKNVPHAVAGCIKLPKIVE